ncbi:20653_t:CDS:2 [Entrophospora sp. SA101]|nr:17878_t:CDS:2 [Entrophospora sp. SA101]CAJ0749686.1 20653_t:CDS:2 [Entrophospora sp. SA101]
MAEKEVTKFQSPDGYSIREWKLTIYAINDVGAKFQANFIEKVEYNLHPTFKNPTRIMKKAPFTIIEKGWGEFDMNIRLFFPDKSIDPWNIDFDLNFQKPHYEFHRLLKKEIPVLHDSRISSVSSSSSAVKSKLKPEHKLQIGIKSMILQIMNLLHDLLTLQLIPLMIRKTIDYTRLANNLSSLEGNDILEVIDLITRNRTNDMYINDDIDEFHMDLYSLGEDLLKVLWDFTESRLSGRDP